MTGHEFCGRVATSAIEDLEVAQDAIARVLAMCDAEEARTEALNEKLMTERGTPPGMHGRTRWIYGTIVSTKAIRAALAGDQ